MRHMLITALALGLALPASLASAANGDNASADGRYLAPNGPPADGTAALFGRSMTEVQARGVLAAGGYTVVGGFTQSQDGTWRTRATRNGMAAEVGVDTRGRIVVN